MNFGGDALVPEDANVMAFGTIHNPVWKVDYFLYGGNGQRQASGEDQNKDKGVGSRLRLTLAGQARVGLSYYTADDGTTQDNRHHLYGADLDLDVGPFNFQAEYAFEEIDKGANKLSYYGRITYYLYPFTPFFGYDFIKQEGDRLFGKGQERFSLGTGYRVNNYILLKGEYHYHRFPDDANLVGVPDTTHMMRFAAIFIF